LKCHLVEGVGAETGKTFHLNCGWTIILQQSESQVRPYLQALFRLETFNLFNNNIVVSYAAKTMLNLKFFDKLK